MITPRHLLHTGNPVEYIIHIADVHIRLQKRQDEYTIVFDRLYIKCQELVDKNPNTIIYLAGDIVHTKTDMSPEQVNLLQSFLINLANIAPVIMITGNHDLNLNNRSRLDALQPVVNAINHPNIYYLKDSGVYIYENLSFVVMSVFDKPVDYIKSSEVTGKYKIALHHGAVNGSHTAIGFQLTNDHVNLSTFEGYDLTLLGDIHLLQYLNEEKTIAYASSLLQQDHGESLENHGFLLWNLEEHSSEFIEVENDFGYVTVEIEYGVIIKQPKKYPKKSRVKLKVHETTKSQLQEIILTIRNLTDVQSITTQKIKQIKSKTDTSDTIIEVHDVRDIEVQNKLICDFLTLKHDIYEEDLLDGVRHINRITNTKIISNDLPRHATYILKTFEFDNAFSYGEGNSIDFNSMNGIYGLFAHNRSGKSSILDALLFCIFDKCTKTSSATYLLNNRASTFKLKLQFELNGIDYYIERIGNKIEKSGHVRVHVNFYYFDELGNKQILNGKERDDTNKIIRKYVGTYEDFILTSVASQNNNTGFIEMSQKERKELLSQFLDISRFEELYKIASEEIKDVAAVLRNYQKQDYAQIIKDSEDKILILNDEYSVLESKKLELKASEDLLRQSILELTKKIIPTDADGLDIAELNIELEKLQTYKSLLYESSLKLVENDKQFTERISAEKSIINTFNLKEIESALNLRKEAENNKNNLIHIQKNLEIHLKHSNDKLSKLTDLEYDENCSFCMNNIFVRDAISTKDAIQIQLDELAKNKLEIAKLNTILNDMTYIHIDEKYLESKKKLDNLDKEHSKLQLEIEKLKLQVTTTVAKIKENLSKQELYAKYENTLKMNLQYEDELNVLNVQLTNMLKLTNNNDKNLNSIYSDIQVYTQKKSNAEESIEKMMKLEKEYKYYELYLSAVKRDGVPYSIICQVIPQIESEINNVLGQLVDFSVTLQTDEKNINAYIVYDEDNFWPIELISGMEKFISSLAIRTALINITSLPKPNFIAIDEGFTQLDSENLSSVYMLFSYLKSQFDFIIIISHLELLRDMVDKFIDIQKVNGFSKVNL